MLRKLLMLWIIHEAKAQSTEDAETLAVLDQLHNDVKEGRL